MLKLLYFDNCAFFAALASISFLLLSHSVCVCACVRACVRVCGRGSGSGRVRVRGRGRGRGRVVLCGCVVCCVLCVVCCVLCVVCVCLPSVSGGSQKD